MPEWIDGQSSLVLDRRAEMGGQPGLHAILVGVADYQFLPDYLQPPDPARLNFSKLSGPCLTVQALLDWLTSAETQLAQSLKTCRLLWSPHREEAKRIREIPGALPASRRNVVRALRDWRKDACDADQSVTLLYFCGHGLQPSGSDVVLTFSDFLDPGESRLFNCAEFSNITLGMIPCPEFPGIARTQFYFVDACRNFPVELKNFENPIVPSVFDVPTDRQDDREAPVFFGAPPTKFAVGRLGGVSILGEALLHAVRHAAEDFDGQRWRVDAMSLKRGIELYIKRRKLRQVVYPGGSPGEPVLCWLRHAPIVEVECAIHPSELHPEILDGVSLRNADPPLLSLPARFHQEGAVFATEVPAGYYRLHVEGREVNFDSKVALVDQSLRLPWRHEVRKG